jgi:hypothetical protein
MNLTFDHIRRASLNAPKEPNARAIIVALDRYGARFGRACSGKLDRSDKWSFCLKAA